MYVIIPSISQNPPANLTPTRIDPSTRLRRAILLNDVLLVARILRNHPTLLHNPDFTDKSNTSLHLAAIHGCLETAQLLLDKGHESHEISRNSDHDTPLILAARHGHPSVGTLLIQRNPRSIPYLNRLGHDILAVASQNPTSTPLLPSLLHHPDYPSSPDIRDAEGNTPLHHASAAGSLKALRILLAAGASPAAKNNLDWTPLAYSQTVAAEVYFKNVVVEFERRRLEGMRVLEEKERARAAGLRIVEDRDEEEEEQGEEEGVGDDGVVIGGGDAGLTSRAVAGFGVGDEQQMIEDALKRHWSPVERKRPITPGGGLTRREWGAALGHVRTRSGSGN